jgi:hypothetical protein
MPVWCSLTVDTSQTFLKPFRLSTSLWIHLLSSSCPSNLRPFSWPSCNVLNCSLELGLSLIFHRLVSGRIAFNSSKRGSFSLYTCLFELWCQPIQDLCVLLINLSILVTRTHTIGGGHAIIVCLTEIVLKLALPTHGAMEEQLCYHLVTFEFTTI